MPRVSWRKRSDCNRSSSAFNVIAGLVPAISLREARLCPLNRDGRDKPGHDISRDGSGGGLRQRLYRKIVLWIGPCGKWAPARAARERKEGLNRVLVAALGVN